MSRARGFVTIAAVVDRSGRRVLSRRVSITLEAPFCVEAPGGVLACSGKPDAFNTDQGSLPGLDPGGEACASIGR